MTLALSPPPLPRLRLASRDDTCPCNRADGLVKVARGVYLAPSASDNPLEQRREITLARCAALLEISPSARALTHEAAAAVHGLWTRPWEPDLAVAMPNRPSAPNLRMPAVTYCDGARRRRGRAPTAHRHTIALHDDEVCHVNGLPVTTLERTAIDCACDLPPAESICVVDAVFRVLCAPDRFTGRCRARDPEELRAELFRALARQGRRRGVKRVRAVIGIADPFSESPGESVARLVVRASGLPAPVTQYRYEDREEGRRYYIDLAWPQLRIAIEFDGFMKYVSPEDLRAEKRRELRLRRGGWTVFRLVWKDLRQPDLLISHLLGLFPPDSAARDQRVRHLL